MRTLYTQGATTHRKLDDLLGSGRLRMAFQPVVDLGDGSLRGQEALLRIEQDGQWLLPQPWFAGAAASGLTLELELAAIVLALGRIGDLADGTFLAINAAPSTILSGGFLALLDDVDLRQVVIEITENEAIDDYPAVLDVLERLRLRGLRVAVDDAGAGTSTLRHIIRLRPDVVKLDVSLVDEICTDPVQQALIGALVRFAADIGATLVAEGVEDAAQVPALHDLGVALGQGYVLGRPAPLAGRA